ncbi:hypothetical protein AABM38_20530 [Heyndrickxia sp. MSNUG]|uniref:hypothetical protein n=1 Tax=Heyndrickxia sp. MSNUG TaxID=3136677 RepID=UPI003C2B0D10
MRKVSIEEKIVAQAKNISLILASDSPVEMKIMMLETQKDYLNEYLQSVINSLKY